MFTGLVQAVGTVRRISGGGSKRLEVDTAGWVHRPRAGDSISVSGCCLTVLGEAGAKGRRTGKPRGGGGGGGEGSIRFDVVPETLARTRLGSLVVGSRVNLEHAATPATLMGGHVVQGHVDCVASVHRVEWGGKRGGKGGTGGTVWFAVPHRAASKGDPEPAPIECIVPKGSVTVDGVSLTVAGVWSAGAGKRITRGFRVALIPTTLERTTLADLAPGDPVNLEVDAMAKTIVYWLREFGR